MAHVVPGRITHAGERDVVVFLIGMRVNHLWRPDRWGPVLLAMGPMLVELSREPARGLLGFRTLLGAGGPTVVQYWATHEELYAYASDPGAAHRPAWAAFNRRARGAGAAVGIWHETYVVPASHQESIYVDMPSTGLARALGSVTVASRGEAARQRLGPGAGAQPD